MKMMNDSNKTARDPFCGGIQTTQDRKLKINELGIDDVKLVLKRSDLQPSVRAHALDRIRRLEATEQMQGRGKPSKPIRKHKSNHGECLACGVPLLEKGGFHGTGLCGPCCTGESRTAGMLSSEDPGPEE